MTEADNIREEIKELEEQLFRLRGSMNRQDNGLKLVPRSEVLSRTLARLQGELSALERRGAAA